MGRPSNTPAALEAAVASLSTDAAGAQLAPEILAKLLAQAPLTGLAAQFWATPCVEIKSTRAAIYSIDGITREKLVKMSPQALSSYLLYIKDILSQQRHREHLSSHEWTLLWQAISLIPYSPQLYSLVCICWRELLATRASVPMDLSQFLEDILAVPIEDKPQVYDGYYMNCLRLILELLLDQNLSIDLVLDRALQLSDRPRIKNLLFCKELALIINLVESPLSKYQVSKLHLHLEPHISISPNDIKFDSLGFSRRPDAEELPWITSKALAKASTLQEDQESSEEPESKRQKSQDPNCLQLACFGGSYEITNTTQESFWYFVWLGTKTSQFSSQKLLDYTTATLKSYTQFQGSTPFALAQLLKELTSRDQYAQIMIPQINGFMSSYESHVLSSASIYLYQVLKTLNILDTQFQHLLTTKLDPWLAKSLTTGLENTQLPLGVFIDLVGCDVGPVDFSRVTPTRGSFITYLGLCLYFKQKVELDPPQKFIKADIVALIELCQTLSSLDIKIPPEIASSLASVVNETELEPQIRWTAYFLLSPDTEPTIEQFPYAPLPSPDKFKSIVAGVFKYYRFNRNPDYICAIISLMEKMDRETPAWKEFYSFLLNIVCEQSPFSPLRVPISHLVESPSDWKRLFETSSPAIVLEYFDTFKIPQDAGPILASHVDASIQKEFLFRLAKAGGNLGNIVARLLELQALEYVDKIARNFGTTIDGLFRDICPKVFMSWSLANPGDFPWHMIPNSEDLRPYYPIALLPLSWIEDKAMFASYYVHGLKSNDFMIKLKSQYSDRQFELAFKRKFAEIQLKCWSTLAIRREKFWDGFPEPQLTDIWLEIVPVDLQLDDQSACWVMEQIVLSVCRFRHEDLYTALRQIYSIFKSLSSPILAISHFIRSCITLAQLSDSLEPALRHILESMAPQLEGPLISEVLVQYPHFSEILDDNEMQYEEMDSLVLHLTRGSPVNAQQWVKAFVQLDRLEFPVYYASYFCAQLALVLDNLVFDRDQKNYLAPILYRWTRVFQLSSPSWLAFVGRLAGEFQVTEYYNTKESSTERMIEELHRFCSTKGYLTRFSLASYMRRLGPSAVVGGSIQSGSVSNLASIKDLTTKLMHSIENGPSDRLLDPTIDVYQLSTQLYDRVSTCSLYRALRINPNLGPRIVPYEIARACEDESLRQEMSEVIDTQLKNPSVEVKTLMLRIVDECYREGYVTADYGLVISTCEALNLGAMGLMMAEVSRHEHDSSQILPKILEKVNDPDIKYAKQVVPSLETIKLSGWDNLAYSLTSFDGHTASNLRAAGIYSLANLVDKTSYFDYDSAWALGQWDLPARVPTTRKEMLFALFSASSHNGNMYGNLDFEKAYQDCWQVAAENLDGLVVFPEMHKPSLPCARDIFLLENIHANEKCDDNDLRLAREYYFKSQNQLDDLVSDLSLNCQMFCGEKNKEMGLIMARKLASIVESMDDGAKQMSEVQSASVAWLLGDQSTSISILENIVKQPSSRFYHKATVLAKLAEWSAEAHHVADNVIFDEYLEPAVKSALNDDDISVRASTFHIFAKFCDERFGNKALTAELCEARSMRDEQKLQVQLHKNTLREDKENKAAHSKLRKAMQLYEIEQKEYQAIKERLRMYLDNSVQFYLKSLQLGVSNILHDSGRFIALWFANNDFASLETIVNKFLGQVPSHMFIPWVNQLTSRLDNSSTKFQSQLGTLVLRLAKDHPYHTLWSIFSLSLSDNTGSRAIAGAKLLKKCPNHEIISSFGAHMIDVANFKVKPEDKKNFSFSKMKDEKKWWNNISQVKIVSPIQTVAVNPSCSYANVPHIERVDQHISIASGISAPKIIQYIASDGNMYTMLLKGGNDDLRQDAVMEQVFGHVNSYLRADREAKKRRLRARTYAVIPLGPKAGVIEFVQDTRSLINVLSPLHEEADDREWNLVKARDTMHRAFDYGKDARIQAYLEVCRHVRPCFGNFFFRQFRDSQGWLEARSNFGRSTALMSIIGYILGLGDRHCNNILLDIVSGEVVHIDLGIAFDQGKLLRIPETVPFRLTRDFVDALGACGTSGVFDRVAEITLGLMRVQEERIMTVLEVLRYDPLYSWTISSSRNKHAQPGLGNNFTPKSTDADQALLGVRRKLGDKLNVKATVRELVQQATNSRNLALIFEGWCPFY